jgi:hypothetical protein
MSGKQYGAWSHTISGWSHSHPSAIQAEESWLSPFFGANKPLLRQRAKDEHICANYSRNVHHCLDAFSNQANYCQSTISALEKCLRDN